MGTRLHVQMPILYGDTMRTNPWEHGAHTEDQSYGRARHVATCTYMYSLIVRALCDLGRALVIWELKFTESSCQKKYIYRGLHATLQRKNTEKGQY